MVAHFLHKIVTQLRRATSVPCGADLTDGQLLAQFIGHREEAAFEALVTRHGPMVLGVCRRILGNVHDADDAFQATFLVLVHKAASLQGCERAGNWLYGVAYRTALAARTASARRRSKEKQVMDMPDPAVPPQDDWSELRPLLDRELSRLAGIYREAIVLCDLEGKTRKEAARQLGVPESTLSGRLTTAHRQLAKRLARHGLALSGSALAAAVSQSAVSACVPAPLVVSTVKAATSVAVGSAAAGAVSASVTALAEGVLHAMFMTKIKTLSAVVLAFMLTVGSVVVGQALAAPGTAPDSAAVGGFVTEIIAEPGDPGKKADGQKPLAKDDLPAAKAKLADLERKAGVMAKDLAHLKAEIDALRLSIATAEAPKDRVYRKAEELLADMPKDAYPVFGPAFGIERAAARKWVKANLAGRTLEWTTTVTEVFIQGDGPFSVYLGGLFGGPFVSPSSGYAQDSKPFSLGGPFTLGDQACEVLVMNVSTLYSASCTAEEATALRTLKGKMVTLRATVTRADVGNSGVKETTKKGTTTTTQERVPIMLEVTLPAIEGFPRPAMKAKEKE